MFSLHYHLSTTLLFFLFFVPEFVVGSPASYKRRGLLSTQAIMCPGESGVVHLPQPRRGEWQERRVWCAQELPKLDAARSKKNVYIIGTISCLLCDSSHCVMSLTSLPSWGNPLLLGSPPGEGTKDSPPVEDTPDSPLLGRAHQTLCCSSLILEIKYKTL